jgi:hypothetical protein
MKILGVGTRLLNRLVPTVDAHAYCTPPTTSTCYCLNHVRYIRLCGFCSGPQGPVGSCTACFASGGC